jgi:chlorophyllase
MKFSMGQLLRFGIACLLTVAGHQAYAAGEASVKELIIKTKQGVKVDTLVMYPEQSSSQELGVVVMNHGFLMSNSYYRDVLAEIANQGFVIVAPQTIAPGGLPIGKPSTAVEAKSTAEVINWMSSNLSGLVGKSVNFDKLALVNHSRGSKVAWTMLRDGLIDAQAVAAIDPVDGTQDGTGLATSGVQLKVPALIIGTGLGSKKNMGQACAPENVNYKLFWNTVSDSPSWLFVANDYGHMDFLDEKINCGMTCNLCVSAAKDKSRPDLRNWIGTTIGSFFRGVVHGDGNALDSVENNPMNLSLTKANR